MSDLALLVEKRGDRFYLVGSDWPSSAWIADEMLDYLSAGLVGRRGEITVRGGVADPSECQPFAAPSFTFDELTFDLANGRAVYRLERRRGDSARLSWTATLVEGELYEEVERG